MVHKDSRKLRSRLSVERLDGRLLMASDLVGAYAGQTALLADLVSTPAPVEFHALHQEGDLIHFAFVDTAGDVQVWRTDWDADSEPSNQSDVEGVSTKVMHIPDVNARELQRLFPYADGFLLPIERWLGQPYGPGVLELHYIDLTNKTANVVGEFGATFHTAGFDTVLRQVHFHEIADELLIQVSISLPAHDHGGNEVYHINDLSEPFAEPTNMIWLTEFNEKAYFFDDPGGDFVDYTLTEIDPVARTMRSVRAIDDTVLSAPNELKVIGDQLYFTAPVNFRSQLWTSDGTAEGTETLAEFLSARELSVVDNDIVFEAWIGEVPGEHSTEIWTTDGTVNGTQKLPANDPRNLLVAIRNVGLVERERPVIVDASDWERVGNTRVRNIDGQLWVQNSLERTIRLEPEFTLVGESLADVIVSDGRQFFFLDSWTLTLSPMSEKRRASSPLLDIGVLEAPPKGISPDLNIIGQSQGELLISDGFQLFELAAEAPSTFEVVADTNFTSGRTDDVVALGVTVVDSGIYFVDGTSGHLWRRSHDGATLEQLTTSDHRFNGHNCGSCPPNWLVAIEHSDGQIVSIAQDNVYVIKQNGTVEAVFAKEFNLTEFEMQFDEQYDWKRANPFVFANNEIVYWGIKHQLNKVEQTGEEDGPVVSHVGPFFSFQGVDHISLNERLILNSRARELSVIGEPEFKFSDVFAMTRDEERVVFLSADRGTLEMWETDGTNEGSQLLTTIAPAMIDPDNLYFPSDIVNLDGVFIFNDGMGQLIRSDGTSEGTFVLKQFDTGGEQVFSLRNKTSDFVVSDGQALFVAHDPELGQEIWVTDGTVEGTRLAVDLRAGPQSSLPEQLTVWNDTLYFIADAGDEAGREIWTIDLRTPQEPNESDEPSADVDGDGTVGFSDFLILSAAFGQEASDPFLPADINQDGIVGFSDFLILSATFSTVV